MDIKQYILYIPDDVTKLNESFSITTFTSSLCNKIYTDNFIDNTEGCIKVVGGYGLQDTSYMFYDCNMDKLDLSSFNTHNVSTMKGMFEGCNIKNLDLGQLDTSNVTDMSHMFELCTIQVTNFSCFDTHNVTTMAFMFYDCNVPVLDISSFSTENMKDTYHMFLNCAASQIKATDQKILKEINKNQQEA